jgi:hypothetical protein
MHILLFDLAAVAHLHAYLLGSFPALRLDLLLAYKPRCQQTIDGNENGAHLSLSKESRRYRRRRRSSLRDCASSSDSDENSDMRGLSTEESTVSERVTKSFRSWWQSKLGEIPGTPEQSIPHPDSTSSSTGYELALF